MCYDHSIITVQELQHQCISDYQDGSLWDTFTLNPFHVFFSTAEPREDLLVVLLDSLPHWLLKDEDETGARPLDYLIANWTNASIAVFQTTLQKWVIGPLLVRRGATSWMETTQSMVQEVLAEDDKRQRDILCCRLFAEFEYYENVYATSILEMALWKRKLKSGWTPDNDKRQTRYGIKRQTLDRGECRCISGSDVVIPNVAVFLNIRPRASQED